MIKFILILFFTVSAYAQQNGWTDLPLSGGGSGTVTSVGFALPVSVFTVTGSPVTSSGTINGTFINQSPNTIFAGPSSGGSAVPAFRSLVNADIPYSFTAPLINTAGTISITQSGAASNGYLSSTDWNTFNNKQAAGNYITALTGDVTASGPGSVAASLVATTNATITTLSSLSLPIGQLSGRGNLTDAGTDGITITTGTSALANSGASISQHVSDATHNGYLSSADWSIFNGKQASGNYITALTGDVTASGPGSSAASLVATTNATITTLSSLSLPLSQTTGVLPIAKGGTNNGSLAVTAGGTLYTDGSKIVNVGAGTSGQILTSNGASAPTWNAPSSSNILCDLSVGPAQTYTTIGAAITAASAGQSICVQTGTYTENPSISKQLNIYGSGRGAIINGSLTFASGADFTLMQQFRINSGITVNSGVQGVQLYSSWSAPGQTTANNSGNFTNMIQVMQE